MNEAVRGQGSKFYLGSNATSELTSANYVTRVTNIGEFAKEFNLIDVDPELDTQYEEKLAGLKKSVAISLSGNFRKGEDNLGYKLMQAANDSQALVKFGIVRPSGLDGFGGYCYVNKLAISEATNEGLMKWTAEATTSGPITAFTEPTSTVNDEE